MALIRNISDTARWAAIYRARETEGVAPLFCDPFARRLAGDRGEQIARSLKHSEKNAWAWVTRTYLFDQFITGVIAAGCDMVINLAAGLDARPYRLSLPETLKWVEIDLPEVTDYKEEILRTKSRPVHSSVFDWIFPTFMNAAKSSDNWLRKQRTRPLSVKE